MATPASLHPDLGQQENTLLNSLLNLYEQESQIYGRILSLSKQQGDLIHADRHGAITIPIDVVSDLKQAI